MVPSLVLRPVRSAAGSLLLTVCACLLALGLATPARADRDIVHFADSIDVAKGSSIHDAVCFFCSVHVHGTVEGDIVSFFGSVDVDGEASHDVVDFFGGVNVGDNAIIRHDVVNFFGGVELGENASVGKDLVIMFGGLHAANSSSFGGDRVIFPGWVFWGPFAVIFGVVWLIVHEVRRARYRRYMQGF